MSSDRVEVPRRVLLGLVAGLVLSLMATSFLLGRASIAPSAAPDPAPVAVAPVVPVAPVEVATATPVTVSTPAPVARKPAFAPAQARAVKAYLAAINEVTAGTQDLGNPSDFANELLNQVVRQRVGEATAQIREYYMAKAFFADSNQTSIDALLAELDAEELEEDPLEIAVPWEEPNG